ncbi:MAG: rhodanese family protein [Rhizobiales bacterium]|nr:rhodanese family protein [Hyphomicrobiales bacterium]
MTVQPISAEDAKRLVECGATVVDVREADEHARERIPGAKHYALSQIAGPLDHRAPAVIFHCRSGSRTNAAAERLGSVTDSDAYILEGGIEAWKSAGLPIVRNRRQPLELMRQVQIAAGTLALIGVVSGALLHPAFYIVAGVVGAGLVFAGLTGTCGMARLLALAPWNRRPHTAASA